MELPCYGAVTRRREFRNLLGRYNQNLKGWSCVAGWSGTRTSPRHQPGEQPDQQQHQVERPPQTDKKAGKTRDVQDEGLPGPADTSAHGIVITVRTDRPAVPPENEPQGKPKGHTAEHGESPQGDTGPESELNRGNPRPDRHHHPIALGAASGRRSPGGSGSPGQPRHLRPAPMWTAPPSSPAPRRPAGPRVAPHG